MSTQLNYTILELSRIDQVMYSDGSGCYHFVVSYLVEFGAGDEMVTEMFPSSIDQLLQFPMVTKDTSITIRSEGGEVLGETDVGRLEYDTKYAQTWETLRQLSDIDLGSLVKLYIEESAHSSWEGWTDDQVRTIYQLLIDIEKAHANGLGQTRN